jgi:hypothetical protein
MLARDRPSSPDASKRPTAAIPSTSDAAELDLRRAPIWTNFRLSGAIARGTKFAVTSSRKLAAFLQGAGEEDSGVGQACATETGSRI